MASETTKTTKTSATKQPKRPKRNDRNETTVTSKTNHYNNREERTMKFRGKCTFHIRYSLAFKKIILCNLVSEANPSRWQSSNNYVFPKGRSGVNYNRNEFVSFWSFRLFLLEIHTCYQARGKYQQSNKWFCCHVSFTVHKESETGNSVLWTELKT